MDIGTKLKIYRIGKAFTQLELAERTGLTQASISQIESGSRNPKRSVLLTIMAALGRSIYDLEMDSRFSIISEIHGMCKVLDTEDLELVYRIIKKFRNIK